MRSYLSVRQLVQVSCVVVKVSGVDLRDRRLLLNFHRVAIGLLRLGSIGGG